MFVKPYHIKSTSLLKGSERKKLRQQVQLQYPSLAISSNSKNGNDNIDSLWPVKADVAASRIITHDGTIVILYTVDGQPLFFMREQQLVPTLHALARCPDIAPTLTVWPAVIAKLARGADLMLPGVILDRPQRGKLAFCDGRLVRGDVVAVNTSVNRCPVAVGFAAHSSEDLYMCGGSGKAVLIAHVVSDQLCGQQLNIPELGAPAFLVADERGVDHQEEVAEVASVLIESCDIKDGDGNSENGDASHGNRANDDAQADGQEHVEMSPDDVQSSLQDAFARALKVYSTSAETTLPVNASEFYRVYVMPQRDQQAATVTLKQSASGKLAPFITAMQRIGLVTVEPIAHGDVRIVTINTDHPLVVDARPVRTATPSTTLSSTTSVRLSDVYFVTKLTAPFFALCQSDNSSTLTTTVGSPLNGGEVRQLVKRYVKSHNLSEENGKQVRLDGPLASAIGQPATDTTPLDWETLYTLLIRQMSAGYKRDIISGTVPTTSTFHKGAVPHVTITLASRGAGKKVTLVTNLHKMAVVDLDAFAHECQMAAASSTTVDRSPRNMAPGSTVVMVQGHHAPLISRLLVDKFGVNRKHIDGYVETKKPKSKKG